MNVISKTFKYLLLTESALDSILTQHLIGSYALPVADSSKGLHTKIINDDIQAFATEFELDKPYVALISVEAIEKLMACGGESFFYDIYGRIARVVKALSTPPIHLPRSWSEFHYKNRLTFFALPVDSGNYRWIADIEGELRCVRFESVTSADTQQDLHEHEPTAWPEVWEEFRKWIIDTHKSITPKQVQSLLVEEVDLKVIGSSSVVHNRTFEQWNDLLSSDQKQVIERALDQSVRIIGPAGSGKTLALCMRAIKIARNDLIRAQAKKLLVVTHSWAMAERIDGILLSLNGGNVPQSITVLPLLYILQLYGAQVGRYSTSVIGDDSTSGRRATVALIEEILRNPKSHELAQGVSEWIDVAIQAPTDSHLRGDLVLNIYEEITGVLAAGGVSIDDEESLQQYMSTAREDWMPPFQKKADRRFCLEIYRRLLSLLVDRGSITTDQLVLDAIRVLETFSWRMRRESDGFDYIFVDELQLFDSQERFAVQLLGRSTKGVPFTTAEDPSQGVFSVLNSRRIREGVDQSVYLESVHRFEVKIFEFIRFIYQKFQLNTIPLKIDQKASNDSRIPTVNVLNTDDAALDWAVQRTKFLIEKITNRDDRICVVALGDIEDSLYKKMEAVKLQVVQLRSFDDVEQLSYRKKSVVVAPWRFIGGTQFSHLIVVTAGMGLPTTSFARLRELTAIYLACSRAATSLDIACGDYIPAIIREAIDAGLAEKNEPSGELS